MPMSEDQKTVAVLLEVEAAFRRIAEEAGDVPFWNDGGQGREAAIKVRARRMELELPL